jgi:hypothetical protein
MDDAVMAETLVPAHELPGEECEYVRRPRRRWPAGPAMPGR